MLNNPHNIFFSAEGQFLEVSSDTVFGVLSKSAVMSWTVNTSQSFTAYLFIQKNSQGRTVLIRGGKDQVTKTNDAKRIFHDRLTVAWIGLTFKLELKNLQQNDTGNFIFLIYITDPSSRMARASKTIKLTVIKGM